MSQAGLRSHKATPVPVPSSHLTRQLSHDLEFCMRNWCHRSPCQLSRNSSVSRLKMASLRSAHMSRDEVMDRFEQLCWEPVSNVACTLLENKSILQELEEKAGKQRRTKVRILCRSEPIERNRAEGLVLVAKHPSVGTREESAADQECQGDASRARAVAPGHPEFRTAPRENFRVGVRSRHTAL